MSTPFAIIYAVAVIGTPWLHAFINEWKTYGRPPRITIKVGRK